MQTYSTKRALRSTLLGGIAVSGLVLPQVLLETSAQAQGENEFTFEEILVTARKREETLTEVPVSITATTQLQLENAGVTDLTELFATMPGVENNMDGSRIAAKPNIRGVGSTENASIRAKVTSFIDGVPLIGSQGIGSFSGLNRVEILRGPQSAAFGRSTFGGAINYVTRDPGETLEVSLRGGVATDDSYNVSAFLSGPIIGDHLRAAVSFEQLKYGGDGDWVTTDGTQLGDERSRVASIKLGFGATEKFQGEIMYMYTDIDDGNPPVQFAALEQLSAHPDNPTGMCSISGMVGTSCVIRGAVDEDLVPLIFDYNFDLAANPVLDPGTRIERHRVQGNVSTELDNGITIEAIGMYGDETGETWFDRDTFSDGAYNIHVGSSPEVTELYGEVRVASPADSRLNWLVGASIYDYDYVNTVFANVTANAVMDIFAEKATNIGAFFNLGYEITERLTASLEGRYQSDEISGVFPANAARNAPTDIEASETTNSFQPRISLSYEFTDDNNVYLQIARGNNPSGFNVNAVDPLLNATAAAENFDLSGFVTFDEETIWNYEIGVKGVIPQANFRYSAAIYYVDISGYVQPVTINWTPADGELIDGATGTDYFSRLFVNTGNLSGVGVEFEGQWQPTEYLSIDGNIGYSGAEFSDGSCSPIPVDYGVPAIETSPFNCASVDGNAPPLVSRVTSYLAATYTRPINDTVDGFLRIDHAWRSKRYTEQINQDFLEAYHLVNLRVGIKNENFRVEGYVTNLFDEDSPAGAVRFFDPRQPGMVFNTSFQRRRPRQFGIQLGYDF